jgi:hypothetical protein
MARNCDCGAPIPPQVGPGRPRTKCDACRRVRSRPERRKGIVTPLRAETAAAAVAEPVSLETAIRAELDRYGRADSPDGAAALYAARVLDMGGHTGSSAASLLREMRTAVEAAVRGVPAEGDVVDELRAKRRASRTTGCRSRSRRG